MSRTSRRFRFGLLEMIGIVSFLAITLAAMRYPHRVVNACYGTCITVVLIAAVGVAIASATPRSKVLLAFVVGTVMFQQIHLYQATFPGIAIESLFWHMLPDGPPDDTNLHLIYFKETGQYATAVAAGFLCAQIAKANLDD